MKLGVLFPFYCHFLPESFHTLKIESDFYSRQGHWPLFRTGVYKGILLKKKQRRSSFYFLAKTIKLTSNSIKNIFGRFFIFLNPQSFHQTFSSTVIKKVTMFIFIVFPYYIFLTFSLFYIFVWIVGGLS